MTKCGLVFAMRQIPIHSWGGFGSQLFALALALHFDRSPHLTTKIIFHEAGVTRREAEIQNYCSRQNLFSVSDFIPFPEQSRVTNSHNIRKSAAALSRKLTKSLLHQSGLVSSCDSDYEVERLKPWLCEIRGHYSHRSIERHDLFLMNSCLQSNGTRLISNEKQVMGLLSIHYRLGDLVTLKNKNPISTMRLSRVLQHIVNGYEVQRISLSSDSPALSVAYLNKVFNADIPLTILETNSLETINQLQRGSFFIGTNSKLSLWITILRNLLYPKCDSWMPIEMRETLLLNLKDKSNFNRIHFY